jgi:hypothetical protein
MTAPETRAAAHAYATAACSESKNSRMHVMPQAAGIRAAGDEIGARECPVRSCQAACSSGAAALQEPPTSTSQLAAGHSDIMGGGNERRPLTAEGSSVHATALRQLQREQMQQVCKLHFWLLSLL